MVTRHLDTDRVHSVAAAELFIGQADYIDLIAALGQCFGLALHPAVTDVVGIGDEQDSNHNTSRDDFGVAARPAMPQASG